MRELGLEERLQLPHLGIDRGHIGVTLDGLVELDDELRCREDGALGLNINGKRLRAFQSGDCVYMGLDRKDLTPGSARMVG